MVDETDIFIKLFKCLKVFENSVKDEILFDFRYTSYTQTQSIIISLQSNIVFNHRIVVCIQKQIIFILISMKK